MDVKNELKNMQMGRKELNDAIPAVMSNVLNNNKILAKDSALTRKTKELISLGMSIIIKCEECILDHIVTLYNLGCTREELCECLETTIALQACPGIKYSQYALELFDALNEKG